MSDLKPTSRKRKPSSAFGSKSQVVGYSNRTTCRSCEGKLEEVLDLGIQEVINYGDKPRLWAPLVLMKCAKCSLVQLGATVDRDYCFRKSYPYRSGATQTMRDHLKGIVEDVMKRVELKTSDIVVDIGANDGTMLSYYPDNVWKVGFEPALESVFPRNKAPFRNGHVIDEFFSATGYSHAMKSVYLKDLNPAKVITAIAMFYDLEDPNAFLRDVKKVLAPNGLFVLQVNYLPDTLKNNAVGDICHEHLEYYSVKTLGHLLARNGFAVDETSFNSINGGSVRVFARNWKDHPIISEAEIYPEGLDFQSFSTRAREIAKKTRTFIDTLQKSGRTVAVVGASTRGATFLQYAGLAPKTGISKGYLNYCVERDVSKVGKKYLGMPIISEEEDKASPADWYLMAIPWFKTEVLARTPWAKKWIIPMPEPRIIIDGKESPL